MSLLDQVERSFGNDKSEGVQVINLGLVCQPNFLFQNKPTLIEAHDLFIVFYASVIECGHSSF